MKPDDFKHIRTALLGINQAKLGETIGRQRWAVGEYESGAKPIPSAVAYAMMWLAVFGPKPLSFSPTGAPIAPIRNAVGD